jgi:hypothetical protein
MAQVCFEWRAGAQQRDACPLRKINCGWRRADLQHNYSKQQAARQSIGWMMPPPNRKRNLASNSEYFVRLSNVR